MKLIIAGTRDFNDAFLLRIEVVNFFQDENVRLNEVEIVSGKAKGADTLGEELAKKFCLKIKEFPADWNTHGKAAGPIRNRKMAEYATHCIVFWDGKSKGTKNMIEEAKKAGLNTKVITY